MMPALADYLVVSALLATAGLVTMGLKRHAIGVLMGIEMIAGAACLNLAAFGHFLKGPGGGGGAPRVDGEILALFIMVLCALQAALAVALFLHLYKGTGSLAIDQAAPRSES